MVHLIYGTNVGTIINATLQPFLSIVNRNSLFFLSHLLRFSRPCSWQHIPAPVVVKQFQISTPTPGLFIQLHHWCTSPPFVHLSPIPPIAPLIPFHSRAIRSLSQSQPWTRAHSSAWPAWTQLWTLNLSLSALPTPVCCPPPLYPDSTAAYFRRVFGWGPLYGVGALVHSLQGTSKHTQGVE